LTNHFGFNFFLPTLFSTKLYLLFPIATGLELLFGNGSRSTASYIEEGALHFFV